MFGPVALRKEGDLFFMQVLSGSAPYFAFFWLVVRYFTKKEYLCSPYYGQESNKINITISL